MKILHLTDSNVFAGTERHILDLGTTLQECGEEVLVGCPAGTPLWRRASGAKLRTVPVEKRGVLDIAAVAKLWRLLRRNQVDIIHAHNGRTALSAALAVTLARKGKCVVTQHFLAPSHTTRSGGLSSIRREVHQMVAAKAHHFIAISEAVSSAMLRRGDTTWDKLTIVPNGIAPIDASQLTPASKVRKRLGIPETAPLIACMARLEPEKDLGCLIEAMRRVAAHRPDVRCIIAGEGAEQEKLRRQIELSGLEQHVLMVGFRTDALAILAASDVFTLPSPAEPFGLVLLEAMALGKPVVAAAAGGPLEVVIQRKTGLLFAPSQPAQLAAALQRLLDDPIGRARMGEHGRARFEERFTAHRMTLGILSIYQRLVGSQQQRLPAGPAPAQEEVFTYESPTHCSRMSGTNGGTAESSKARSLARY